MSEATMRALIDRALAIGDDAEITFAFQGGEPTCAGLPFFEAFTAVVDAARTRQRVRYALQTNGYAIDEAWAAFFKRHGVLVGVSLDGYREVHDSLRPDARGQGTHARVMESIGLLREAGVDVNILTVLTAQLARRPQRLYRFIQQQGFEFVQLIPCLPGLDEERDAFSLTPELFASFYTAFFRLWLEELKQGTYRSITLFDNVISLFAGMPPQQCGMLGACAPQFVVESNGDVFPCDFYVLDRYRCGNVATDDLDAIATSDAMRAFLTEERRPCARCADCPFEGICHRNCKRLSIAYYREDFCGYRSFLEEAAPAMRAIARGLRRR